MIKYYINPRGSSPPEPRAPSLKARARGTPMVIPCLPRAPNRLRSPSGPWPPAYARAPQRIYSLIVPRAPSNPRAPVGERERTDL